MATAEGSPNLQPQATLRRRSSTPEKPTDSALDQVEIPSAPTAVAPPRLKMSCRRRAHPPTPKGRRDLPGLPSGGAWLKQSPQARRFLEILLGRVAGFQLRWPGKAIDAHLGPTEHSLPSNTVPRSIAPLPTVSVCLGLD